MPKAGNAASGTVRRVSDQKPPRSTADERTTAMMLLQFQRESLVRKLTGVSQQDAAASPVGSGTSLLWLANHLADAETNWVLRRFAGLPAEEDADHRALIDDALARYRRVWARVDGVVADANLDQSCPPFDGEPAVNLRWILLHLLEETARHAGHADILRELADGSTGR